MKQYPEETVLEFFKLIDFPGIRLGEKDPEICKHLRSRGYKFTPDLIAGPPNIKDAQIEGLFFIDVIQPTTDLLFRSEFYKESEIDVPKVFKKILEQNFKEKASTYIDMLPTLHHECYLGALNKKLSKYAHQRKVDREGGTFVSANFGLVHHFDMGELRERRLSDVKKLITLLDYFRFYKKLAPNKNVDLRNAENLLLNELVNENQVHPYLLAIGREWNDIPCLFNILHISITKNSKTSHLALMSLNISHLDNSDKTYPIHKWFGEKIFHPKTKFFLNDEYKEKKIVINIDSSAELFS